MEESTATKRRIIITSGGAAFLLALAGVIWASWGGIRGPQIEVGRPTGIFLYREGRAESSAISVAVRIPMTNRSNYNDFVRGASLSIGGQDAIFENSGQVRMDFIENDDSSALCRPQTRCLALKRLAVTDVQDDNMEVPARGFRSGFLSFRLVCSQGQDCSRYRNSEASLLSLRERPLDIVIRIQFSEDGQREVRCRTGPINVQYVRSVGWQGLRCIEASVQGASRYSLF